MPVGVSASFDTSLASCTHLPLMFSPKRLPLHRNRFASLYTSSSFKI